jgi:hypothetical protein
MLGVYAARIVAGVAAMETSRDLFAVEPLPGKPMGLDAATVVVNLPVPAPISADPIPALVVAALIHLSPEPLFGSWSIHR